MSFCGFICAILAILYLFTFGGYFLEINKSYLDYQDENETKKSYDENDLEKSRKKSTRLTEEEFNFVAARLTYEEIGFIIEIAEINKPDHEYYYFHNNKSEQLSLNI